MQKIRFWGREWCFYIENVNNDYLPIIRSGSLQVTTRDAKRHIDNIIFIVSNVINAGSIFNEKLEKYRKALTVLRAVKAIFSGRIPEITAEATKIAIEVVQEIALMDINDPTYRAGIQSAAFVAKLFIDGVSKNV